MIKARLFACATLGAVLAAAAPTPAAEPDGKAVALADQVMEALGGKDAWNATRYLRFDFAVEREGKLLFQRAHLWDKWKGLYRLDAKTREGKPYRVVMNLHTKQGAAWMDGQRLAGEEEKKLLDQGYAVWVNDTYWLLMPYKMRDPGVTLASAGEAKEGDTTWDKVLLTFDSVGLTPKDRYWAFVNRSTHLVDRWEYVLKGADEPPTPFAWKGWKKMGRIMLADDRVNPKDGTRIFFPVLEVPESVPAELFAEAEAPASPAPASSPSPRD